MTVSLLGNVGIVALAMGFGFLIGRTENRFRRREVDVIEGEDVVAENNRNIENISDVKGYEERGNERRQIGHSVEKKKRDAGRHVCGGKVVASPVAGRVQAQSEDGVKSVTIMPEEGNLYAPVFGKIIKLYPMGNAFLIRMEDHTQIEVRVGGHPDELCAEYFCPRVIENEIVNKGKLLLVYDREQLLAAGEDVSVMVNLKDDMSEKKVLITQAGRVKVGDELMQFEHLWTT